MRHKRYDNVYTLGDVANLPTSKTGAAIRKQAPVVVANLAGGDQRYDMWLLKRYGLPALYWHGMLKGIA